MLNHGSSRSYRTEFAHGYSVFQHGPGPDHGKLSYLGQTSQDGPWADMRTLPNLRVVLHGCITVD